MTLLSRIACSTVLAAAAMTATVATADELHIAAPTGSRMPGPRPGSTRSMW